MLLQRGNNVLGKASSSSRTGPWKLGELVAMQSSEVFFPHVLPLGSQGGIPRARKRECMPPCGSRFPSVELRRASGRPSSLLRLEDSQALTGRTSARSYDLLCMDREVLYRHPVPSSKAPATPSMKVRFILQLSSPGIYHGKEYLSENHVPAPKTHNSQ